MRIRPTILVLLAVSTARGATAQDLPEFSQTFNYPSGTSSYSSRVVTSATYDTSASFIPYLPPDNDLGTTPIISSFQYVGESGHWRLSLKLSEGLNRLHNWSTTVESDPAFRLLGLPLDDTALLRVQLRSVESVVSDGNNGLLLGRCVLSSPMGSDTHELSHYMDGTLVTTVDTLIVPVQVLGNTQTFSFHLSLLSHIEMAFTNGPNQMDVVEDLSFLDVPQGMYVVNGHGYGGNVVLDAPAPAAHPGRLSGRVRSDGRSVMVRLARPGAPGAELAFYDLSGRRLARRWIEGGEPGTLELEVPLGEAQSSGIYFLRCSEPESSRATRVVFIR
jgi:hypothetical protein